MHGVDFFHDPLGPLNGRRNQRLRRWARFRIEEIFRCLPMASHDYSRHHREHLFVSLVGGTQRIRLVCSSPYGAAISSALGDAHTVPDPFKPWLSESKNINAGTNISEFHICSQNDDAVMQLRCASRT